MTKRILSTVGILALVAFQSLAGRATETNSLPLSELAPVSARQDYGSLELDRSVMGQTLTIGEREIARGLGTHANSRIVYDLAGRCTRFTAWVGVDAEMKGYTASSVDFQVFGDGKKLFDSGVMRIDMPAKDVSVDLRGVKELALVVTDAGDGNTWDHADWADAMVFADVPFAEQSAPPELDRSPKYEISVKNLVVKFSANGEIVGAVIDGLEKNISGETRLGGCVQVGQAKVERHRLDGGLDFTRTLRQIISDRTLTVVDRFQPADDSVRWETEIVSDGAPWTTDIATELNYPATAATRFWTAWSDPEHRNDGWRDPRELLPFANQKWDYSNLSYMTPEHGDYISLPLVAVAEPARDTGFSLVLSPEDHILTLHLATQPDGEIRFTRQKNRLGGGKPVRFAMDLVAHEADWRGGLRWMPARYPKFFEPPNPHADAMVGCGAYSGDENPVDVAKLKQMAFRINWKLSGDFPYMGMFIPPVTNADERWERSCDEKAPSDKRRWTGCRRLDDYARYMKTNGFYVLDYFNVTEFGKNMGGAPVRKPGDPELWKDPRAFLKYKLPNAVLDPRLGTYYGAKVTDCGDPDYQQFILKQADRHIRLLPDTAGICIDRMDWLRHDNLHADDGVSWVNGKPVRSLVESWKSLMRQLGPKMHGAGKVIFVNPMTMRLDLMAEVDGFYSEHGESGPGLNSIAWVAMRKPALTWTCMGCMPGRPATYDLKPDPDSFFQRHLLMGVYPTAPYPFNNHALLPNPETDRHYLDYGPLLDAMRGKNWVLAPHCVETTTTGVKVNLFQVPGGYSLPVTFGGKDGFADVVVRNVPGLEAVKCSALHPAEEKASPVESSFKDGALTLHVTLQRGCAMVLLQK